MEGFIFENQGANTYLAYKLHDGDTIDSMSLGMLTNNKIPGLAPTLFQQIDTEKYIKYNISAKVPVKQFFLGTVKKKQLLGVLLEIVNAMISVEDYMLDPDSILMDLDYIYTDVSTHETVLICLPVALEQTAVDFCMFLKNIIFTTQFDQTENCDYVAKIINYLNQTSGFSLLELKRVLEGLEGTGKPESLNKREEKQGKNIPFAQSSAAAPFIPEKSAVAPETPKLPAQPSVVAAVPKEKPKKAAEEASNSEEKMSWLYLMQHYNKENAAIYKAQKEKKKQKKAIKEETSSHGASIPQAPLQNFPQNVPGMQMKVPQNIPIKPPEMPKNTPIDPPAPQSATGMENSQGRYADVLLRPGNYGETTVLGNGSSGETVVLSNVAAGGGRKPYLTRMRSGERIMIDKPVFRIGKEKSYVDYFIGDNPAISRSHANIIVQEDGCYIVDTNSTNRTYVNGQAIVSGTQVKLESNMRIQLGDEEFLFQD